MWSLKTISAVAATIIGILFVGWWTFDGAQHKMPRPSTPEPISPGRQSATLTLANGKQIYLQETEIPLEEVVPKLQAIAKTGYKERIFVKGDKAADYGTIMKVMAQISGSGFKNIGLVSLPEGN